MPSVAPDLPRKLRRCLGPGSGRPRSRICDSWRPASATRLSAPRCSGTAVSVRALTATAVARAITASSRGRQWAVTRGRLWASCRGRPHCRSSRRSAARLPVGAAQFGYGTDVRGLCSVGRSFVGFEAVHPPAPRASAARSGFGSSPSRSGHVCMSGPGRSERCMTRTTESPRSQARRCRKARDAARACRRDPCGPGAPCTRRSCRLTDRDVAASRRADGCATSARTSSSGRSTCTPGRSRALRTACARCCRSGPSSLGPWSSRLAGRVPPSHKGNPVIELVTVGSQDRCPIKGRGAPDREIERVSFRHATTDRSRGQSGGLPRRPAANNLLAWVECAELPVDGPRESDGGDRHARPCGASRAAAVSYRMSVPNRAHAAPAAAPDRHHRRSRG